MGNEWTNEIVYDIMFFIFIQLFSDMTNNIKEVISWFERDVANHQVVTTHESEVVRVMHAATPGVSFESFTVTIMKDRFLTISGDAGNYMFDLSSTNEHRLFECAEGLESLRFDRIGKALLSIDKTSGYMEFSPEMFREKVIRHVNVCITHEDLLQEDAAEIINLVKSEILCADDEFEAMMAIQDFHDELLPDLFTEFSWSDVKAPTVRFLWCCFAIAWALKTNG